MIGVDDETVAGEIDGAACIHGDALAFQAVLLLVGADGAAVAAARLAPRIDHPPPGKRRIAAAGERIADPAGAARTSASTTSGCEWPNNSEAEPRP